jgi:fructose-1,6-bisphosphatase II
MTAVTSFPVALDTGPGLPGQLVWDALAATRATAVAAARLTGSGDAAAADAAATNALRAALSTAAGEGTVIATEGAKDGAATLADGERVGDAAHRYEFDVAVDLLECTDLCARGLQGALVTIALAPGGSLWRPGPALYMDKLVVPPAARGATRITDPPERTVANVAGALGKEVADLTVVVLDKPRHHERWRWRSAPATACTSSPARPTPRPWPWG